MITIPTSYSASVFGLTGAGYVNKLQGDFFLDFLASMRGSLGSDLVLDPNTDPLGQITWTIAGAMSDADAQVKEMYDATDPADASGKQLADTGAITGSKPIGDTPSKVICNATLAPNTTITTGLIANVAGQPLAKFALQGACDSSGNVTGTLASGPTAGTFPSLWEATNPGPVPAPSGQLTVIPSLPAGLTGITNPLDAVLGTVAETDAQFRLRRDAELAASGRGTVISLRAALLEVTGIETCTVYENTGDTTDAQGRPPHSVEACISDGVVHAVSDDTIAQVLFEEAQPGIPYVSLTGDFGIATDAAGNTHVVPFSRVTFTPIYVTATTTPTGNEAAVKAAIVSWGNSLPPGSPVVRTQLMAAALKLVEDVPTLTLGLGASPTGTSNIPIASSAIFDTSRILVNGL